MYKRTLTVFVLFTLTAGVQAAFGQTAPAERRVEQTPKPAKPPKTPPDKSPAATPAPQEDQVQVEPVNVKLARGGKVAISSRSGQIIVSGWDRDSVQATATGENGPVQVIAQTTGDPARPRLLLTISARRYGRDARLEVKVPRYADVETLEGYRGEIEVADLEGPLINAGNGDVRSFVSVLSR
jgi:hypothetical protein